MSVAAVVDGGRYRRQYTKHNIQDHIDALYALPINEFTAARDALAKELKKQGGTDDAAAVKALLKPSVSAWAVNQLYWNHREAFERLIAAGQQLSRKFEDKQFADARRKAISDLVSLAADLMRDSGHNATSDTIRRMTSTLEAISAYASTPGAPVPGRLTADLEPPGFEALAALMSGGTLKKSPALTPARNLRNREEVREAKLAEAKAKLRDAEHELKDARGKADTAESKLKKAVAQAKEAEKRKREAQEQFEKANASSKEADERARTAAKVAEQAAKAAENSARLVQKASAELQSLDQIE